MRLPELLIVVSLVIIGIGFRRALRHQTRGPASKTALLLWLVLFVGSLLAWNWAAHRVNGRPLTLDLPAISATSSLQTRVKTPNRSRSQTILVLIVFAIFAFVAMAVQHARMRAGQAPGAAPSSSRR